MFLQKKERTVLLFLFLSYFIVRLLLVSYAPFVRDESYYAMMINEQIEHPTIIPTFMGHDTGWKPTAFFWIYAFFVNVLKNLSISLEAVYRLPTEIFGIINVFLLFYLVKKLTKSFEIATITSLIYNFTFLVIYVNNTVLTDTLLNTFILAALLSYFSDQLGHRRFFLAFIFSSLAFLVKLVMAFIIPVLAVIYFLVDNNRSTLKNPYFLFSLLSVPLTMLTYNSFYTDPTILEGMYKGDISSKFLYSYDIQTIVGIFYSSFVPLFSLAGIWFFLSLGGFLRHWRNNLFMAFWFILILIPLLSAPFLPWYFLTVIPPVCYFAALFLVYDENKKVRLDTFFKTILFIFIVASFLLGFWWYSTLKEDFEFGRMIGTSLAGIDNVAFIGTFAPEMIAYKVLEEQRHGMKIDYGWILIENITKDSPVPFVENYWHEDENVAEDSFFRMMWDKNKVFRKSAKIYNFDYIVLIGLQNTSIQGEVLYNSTKTLVVKIR